MDEPKMTRDGIISIGYDAGFSLNDGIISGGVSDLERFAALVIAHDRESIAAEAERNGNHILAMQIRARRIHD
jgi:hypothetical protein